MFEQPHRVFPFLVLLCLLVQAATAAAQQTGAIAGKVTDTSGAVYPASPLKRVPTFYRRRV